MALEFDNVFTGVGARTGKKKHKAGVDRPAFSIKKL